MSNSDASPEQIQLPDYHGHQARLAAATRLPGMPPVPTGVIEVRSMTPEESARQAAAERAEQEKAAREAAAAAHKALLPPKKKARAKKQPQTDTAGRS